LEHRLADGILSEEYEKGSVLTVSAHGGKLSVDVTIEQEK